jgi:hypothetical protein
MGLWAKHQSTDAQSQGENGCREERGILAELAEGEAAIRHYGVKPIADSRFANPFFDLFDSAKFDPRGTLGLVGHHARANVFLDQQFEVRKDFLVEV